MSTLSKVPLTPTKARGKLVAIMFFAVAIVTVLIIKYVSR